MQRFGGKTAVVTGASSGIGLAIARRLADEGAHVYLTARRKPQLDKAAAKVGPSATAVQADVSDLADLDRLYGRIDADGRRLDVVIANAGGGRLATLQQTSEQFFDNAFNTNVRGRPKLLLHRRCSCFTPSQGRFCGNDGPRGAAHATR